MKTSRRGRFDGEAGFTLVELLVVMLVLGILAAVALPSFFNQKSKAADAKAKQVAHTAQVAMEACNGQNKGTYSTANCKLANLRAIEPSIPSSTSVMTVTPSTTGYTIQVKSGSENAFKIVRAASGGLTFSCTVASSNRGGCPGTGTKAGTWGP